MSIEGDTIFGALKAAAWERAKGELRALVAIKGAAHTAHPEEPPFKAAEQAVEAFIRDFEDNGLHE